MRLILVFSLSFCLSSSLLHPSSLTLSSQSLTANKPVTFYSLTDREHAIQLILCPGQQLNVNLIDIPAGCAAARDRV